MKIDGTQINKIQKYKQDKDKFYLLNLIAKTEGAMLYSDMDTYIIGRSRVGLPTWVWTSDDIKKEKLLELEKDLKNYLEKGKNDFTCKKSLYEILKNKYNTTNYFEMGYLSCKNLIKPVKRKGIFVRPNYGDKTILAKLWIDNRKEMDNEDVELSEALEMVDNWLNEKNFYVLKDTNGKIVCMASYNTIDDTAKITHVFTPKEERKKGYCKSLMYELTKKLQSEGLKPLLYTDYNYEPSNKAYKSIGYLDEGILINFTIEGE